VVDKVAFFAIEQGPSSKRSSVGDEPAKDASVSFWVWEHENAWVRVLTVLVVTYQKKKLWHRGSEDIA
jgi:hypothetical protein